jgi:hypothetical protein
MEYAVLFLNEFGVNNVDENVEFPADFDLKSDVEKVAWLNNVCEALVRKCFF